MEGGGVRNWWKKKRIMNELKKYDIHNNKGYGTKKHLNAIKEYGITKWHRKTFGICKEYC